MSSQGHLRCPECRILVDVKVDDLPPNIILMRILSGLKNTNNGQPHSANFKQSINSETTSIPSINIDSKANGNSIRHFNAPSNERGYKDLDSILNDQQHKRIAAANNESVQRASVAEQGSNENQSVDIRSHLVTQQHSQQNTSMPIASSKSNLSVTPHAKALYNFESNESGWLLFFHKILI